MENLEGKNNDVILDGVNVSALRRLDECLLRGERAFAKAEAGITLSETEETDLRDFYHKLQLIASVRSTGEPKANDSGFTKTIGIKK